MHAGLLPSTLRLPPSSRGRLFEMSSFKRDSVVGEDMILPQLTPYGEIVDEAINAIPKHYPHIKLLQYVIMPNHIHVILFIPYDGGRMISSPTSILMVVGQMKRYVSKKVGMAIWQKSFHDHIIRDKNDYEKISRYIHENPIKWRYDCLYTEE